MTGITELHQHRGKWVVVQASIQVFGLNQLCGRLVEIRPDGLELVCAGHRAFINSQHVVGIMVPDNQDDFIACSLEQALKKVRRDRRRAAQ